MSNFDVEPLGGGKRPIAPITTRGELACLGVSGLAVISINLPFVDLSTDRDAAT